MSLRSEISRAIADARDRAASPPERWPFRQETELPPIGLERPANPDHGDWASNAAMQLAPVARSAPLADRGDPARAFRADRPAVAEVSVAAPGFLNFRLDPAGWRPRSGRSATPALRYGRRTAAQPQRINVEFVSANPTGPLHVGNARGAFVGDVLSRVLEAAGHDVDARVLLQRLRRAGEGTSAHRSARSGRDAPLPEDGYRGDYVGEMAASRPGRGRARRRGCRAGRGRLDLRALGVRAQSGRASRRASTRLGVHFDVWRDGELRPRRRLGGARRRAASRSRPRLRGGWRDLVPLDGVRGRQGSRRSSGPTAGRRTSRPTSATSAEKFSRGFDELIYVWGADHHGDRRPASSMRPTRSAIDPEAVRMLLIAWVRFVRDGVREPDEQAVGRVHHARRPARRGRRRRGALVLQLAGIHERHRLRPRARQAAEQREPGLLRRSTRMPAPSSILRNAAEVGVTPDASRTAELLRHPSEQALVRHLLDFPDALAMAAERRETHEVPRYAYELASAFSPSTATARCSPRSRRYRLRGWPSSTPPARCLSNALDLLGISAPDIACSGRQPFEPHPIAAAAGPRWSAWATRTSSVSTLGDRCREWPRADDGRVVGIGELASVGRRVPGQAPGRRRTRRRAPWRRRRGRRPIPRSRCLRDGPGDAVEGEHDADGRLRRSGVASTSSQPSPSAAARSGTSTESGVSRGSHFSMSMICSVESGGSSNAASSSVKSGLVRVAGQRRWPR